MSLLTLRVSKRDERTLVYVLLSLDPNERVETSEIEHTLPDTFQAVLSRALTDVEQCLRVGSKARLEKVGSDLARDLLPEVVKTALIESKDSYLYLDLEDTLVSFPWECIRIGDSFIGTKFKAGRHIRVTDEGRAYKSLSDKQRCAIIANPDGSLKDAAKEGDLLADQLKTLGDVDLLKTNVTVNEACEVIASKDVFHFAGHSSGTGLRFSDRDMTAGDIASLPSVPRMVFLNSCDSGSLNSWANVEHSVVRAFLQAGSRAVIAAASPVATEQAAETARRFYERFLQKETLGQSLTAASTYATDELAWARYVVFGHPEFKLTRDEASSTKKISKRTLLLAGLAACAMLAVVGALSFKFSSKPTPGLTDKDRVREEACLQGNSSQCSTLGESLLNRGKARDAISYLEKACQDGLPMSCVSLIEGYLAIGNIEMVKKLVLSHCIEGDGQCQHVGMKLAKQRLDDLALAIFQKRCLAGNSVECSAAALIKGAKGDIAAAADLDDRACRLGEKISCVSWANYLRKSGQVDQAVQILTKLCTPHEQDGACVGLGQALMVQGKTRLALSTFKKACRAGLVTSGVDCAVAAASLDGVFPDAAKIFYQKSCDFGETSACARMASRAVQAVHPCGALSTDDCYQLGYQFQKSGDLDRAEKIYLHLCNREIVDACNDLAVIYQKRGKMELAKKTLRNACDKKVAIACSNLAGFLDPSASTNEALILYKEACNLKHAKSCFQAALILQKSNSSKDAEDHLVKACQLEDPSGCNNLALLKSGKYDKEGAKNDYKKACDLGLSLGCRNLAILLNDDGGIEEAKTVLKKSCDRGDVLACDWLNRAGVAH